MTWVFPLVVGLILGYWIGEWWGLRQARAYLEKEEVKANKGGK